MDTSIQNTSAKHRGRPRSDKRLHVVARAQQHLDPDRPMTLRHLFYLLISDGLLENNPKSYADLSSWICDARMEGLVPFRSIVDGIRHTIKPSSWSGLADFTETVQDAYRKDLWQQQPDYVEFWFEKDAIIGVVQDITDKYDIKIRPLRGQSSLTFLHDAAWELFQIQKPIYIYYFGDHDPSGYSIEDSARERLGNLLKRCTLGDPSYQHIIDINTVSEEELNGWQEKFDGGLIYWRRLGFLSTDFDHEFEFEDSDRRQVLRLKAKRSDHNFNNFVERFGSDDAAELDALPMDVIRNRVEQTILSHVDKGRWEELQHIEKLERESFQQVLVQFQT